MAEEKSLRHKVADRLAETVRNAGYNNPYGGRVYLSRREGRKFYAISFSYLNSVQGVINVYDTNFIQIEYRSGNMVDNPVFEAEKDAELSLRLVSFKNFGRRHQRCHVEAQRKIALRNNNG
jgi:hypothetical protein